MRRREFLFNVSFNINTFLSSFHTFNYLLSLVTSMVALVHVLNGNEIFEDEMILYACLQNLFDHQSLYVLACVFLLLGAVIGNWDLVLKLFAITLSHIYPSVSMSICLQMSNLLLVILLSRN